MKNPHDVILRPVLTEKGYDGIADKRYVFEVAIDANKIEIKKALEKVFPSIKVARVNTLRTLGKMKRQGVHQGRTPRSEKSLCDPDGRFQAHRVLRGHGVREEEQDGHSSL